MAPRLDKAALFEMLGYQPHAGQLLVHRSKAARRVLACGVRFGKTTCGAMEAIAALMQPCASSIGWIVGPNYSHAERIFQYVVSLVQTKLPHRVIEVSPREHRLLVCNLGAGRSEVRAKTADNAASLLGEGLDWLVVDEAARLSASIWEQHLSQRLLDKRGWALLLSTPRGCDWFYQLYKRGQKNRDASYVSWTMPTSANPHLDPDAVEAERARLPENAFAQEYLAEFVGQLPEPCDTCGGPSPDVVGMVVVYGFEDPPNCPECGEAVDDEGRTIVSLAPNGEPHLRIMRLILPHENDIIEPLSDYSPDPDDPVESDSALVTEPAHPRVDRDFFRGRAG